MANIQQAYPNLTSRRIIAQRLDGEGPSLPQALLGVARALEAWYGGGSLCYAGETGRKIELNESALSSYLEEVQKAWARGIPEIFRLATDPDVPQIALFFGTEPTPIGNIEYVWFSLPAANSEKILQLDQLVDLIATISLRFGSFHSYLEDEPLLKLYCAKRASARARAAIPPELRQFVPEPQTPNGTAGTLPQLLVPQEFDHRQVPDAVWWINFWDRIQVETIGMERIRMAGWSRLIEQANDAIVLVAINDPVNVTNASHLKHLSQLVDHLKLRQLQERYRYKTGV